MLTLFLAPLLAVMGWDDALIIGGISAALSASGAGLSSWLGNSNSKKQLSRDAKRNYIYSLRMAMNGPSSTVKGLRKAGLNPILAATDGSFATPSMPSVSSNGIDSKVDTASALSTAMSVAQTKSNIDLQDSTSELNDANTKLAGVKAANELANRGLNGSFGALSRVLSEFGFDSKTVNAILPAFGKGKSTPNGSSRSDGSVKISHVASDGSMDSLGSFGYDDDSDMPKYMRDMDDDAFEYIDNQKARRADNAELIRPLTAEEVRHARNYLSMARENGASPEEFFGKDSKAVKIIRNYLKSKKRYDKKYR